MEKFCAPIFVETAVEPQIPQINALQPKLSSRCNTQNSILGATRKTQSPVQHANLRI